MNAKKQYRITYPDGTIALAMGLDGVAELLGVSLQWAKQCFVNGEAINDCKIERLQFVYKSVEWMNHVLSGFRSESDHYLEFEEQVRQRSIEAIKELHERGTGRLVRNEIEKAKYGGGWHI